MKLTIKEWIVILYTTGAIVTFGHAWHRDYGDFKSEFAVVAAPFCAAAWPLYWSEVFWKGQTK